MKIENTRGVEVEVKYGDFVEDITNKNEIRTGQVIDVGKRKIKVFFSKSGETRDFLPHELKAKKYS